MQAKLSVLNSKSIIEVQLQANVNNRIKCQTNLYTDVTRMHSSRMRTIRCCGHGGCLPGGVCPGGCLNSRLSA